MATTSDHPNVPPVAEGDRPFITVPVVFRRRRGGDGGGRRRKRRKVRRTRGTKPFERLALGVSETLYDLTNGAARGLRRHVRGTKRSRRRRKDGLVRDFVRNAGRGLQRAFIVGSRAPRSFTRRVGTRPLWRTTRGLVIPVINPFFGGR